MACPRRFSCERSTKSDRSPLQLKFQVLFPQGSEPASGGHTRRTASLTIPDTGVNLRSAVFWAAASDMLRVDPLHKSPRQRPRGSALVETGVVLLVFLAMMFLLTDEAWGIFVKVTLQHAVRMGVRTAVSGITNDSGMTANPSAAIKQVVQTQSMGLLSSSDVNSYVTITYFTTTTNPPQQVTGANANAANNLVVVSLNNWPLQPLAPLLRSSAPVLINVSSADLVESTGMSSSN